MRLVEHAAMHGVRIIVPNLRDYPESTPYTPRELERLWSTDEETFRTATRHQGLEVASFLGKRFQVTLVVSELEPMTRSAVCTSAGPVRLEGSYRFEPVPGGTRFTMAGEVGAHGFFSVAEPVFAGVTRREAANSCQRLKRLLEAEVTADAP